MTQCRILIFLCDSGSGSSDGSARSSDASTPSSNTVPQVENLRWIVNAFLWPQTLRGRQVLSAYHAQSSFVSVSRVYSYYSFLVHSS